MSKTLIYLVGIAIIIIGALALVIRPNQSVAPAPTATATPNPYAGWLTYSNPTYGFSFKYPATWGDVSVSGGSQSAESGSAFGGNFSKNNELGFGGQTVDFVKGIDGGFTSFAGCVSNGNGTYGCRFAGAADAVKKVTPTEVLKTIDGSPALIIFNQEWPEELDAATRGAYVNLSGTTYPGIAFEYQEIPTTDIPTFDLMVQSVTSIK